MGGDTRISNSDRQFKVYKLTNKLIVPRASGTEYKAGSETSEGVCRASACDLRAVIAELRPDARLGEGWSL